MTSGVFWMLDVKGALGHLREVSAPRLGAGGVHPLPTLKLPQKLLLQHLEETSSQSPS